MYKKPAAGPRFAGASRAADASVCGVCAAILSAAIFAGGCASPGEPYERKAPVPTAITDLSAEQHGDSVVLTFNMPKESVERRPLKEPPEVEIYRGFAPPSAVGAGGGAAASAAPATRPAPILCATIPAADLPQYGDRGYVRYADTLHAEDLAHRAGWIAEYTVRTRSSDRKESANSNFVDLVIYPAPDAIDDLKTEVSQSGVALSWSAPTKTATGPAPPISRYVIYRADRTPTQAAGTTTPAADANAAAPAQNGATGMIAKAAGSRSVGPAPLVKIAESDATSFLDSQAEFGRTYDYSVRSVVQYPGEMLESADSNFADVTPKDIFPPAAPQGLVIALVPREGAAPASLDLSWAISPETDIAGYNVYRSEQEGASGTRQNAQLLLTPAFRDMNALPGHRYFYTVTAVDRAGNESPASAAISGGVPAEN